MIGASVLLGGTKMSGKVGRLALLDADWDHFERMRGGRLMIDNFSEERRQG